MCFRTDKTALLALLFSNGKGVFSLHYIGLFTPYSKKTHSLHMFPRGSGDPRMALMPGYAQDIQSLPFREPCHRLLSPGVPLPHAGSATAQSPAVLSTHRACSYLDLIQPLHTPAGEQTITFSPQANSPETQTNAMTV